MRYYTEMKGKHGLVCKLSDSFNMAILTNTGRDDKGTVPPEEDGLPHKPPYQAGLEGGCR